MDFFKAVFSDDPQPPPSSDSPGSREHNLDESDPNPAPTQSSNSNTVWNFGGLIKTLASKSESVIDTYRRDLEEFSSGLKKETAIIREAASRAVKDLPASLDVGASVAQESLESVGQAIDNIGSTVWNSTSQIVSHGRHSLLAADSDSEPSDYNANSDNSIGKQPLRRSIDQNSDVKRYSRFESLVCGLQSDVNTYLEEPEDLENYIKWKLGFELDKKAQEIQDLIEENEVIEEIYGKVVPSRTDYESFWSRYFYRLHKLQQAEDARAKLVKRAISGDEEEDLSWDVDDDDGYEPKGNSSGITKVKEEISAEVATDDGTIERSELKKVLEIEKDVKSVTSESETDGGDKSVKYGEDVASNTAEAETVSEIEDKLDVKYHDQAGSEVKTDHSGSCKDSDISVVSSQPSMPEEEELGWDAIEDIGSSDENKGDDDAGTTRRIDLRKRLSSADQEEDLNWDIEDDD